MDNYGDGGLFLRSQVDFDEMSRRQQQEGVGSSIKSFCLNNLNATKELTS